MPTPSTCQAIQYSDQKRCDRCNLVWDMNDDDPPDCLTDEEMSQSIGRAAVRDMRTTTARPVDRVRAVKQERDAARRDYKGAIEYITHKGLYAEYLAMTGKKDE